MPFAKRIVEPQLLCRHSIPNEEGQLFEDLCSINNVALSRTLRQLSDLAKHACSIFQELESDIVSTNQRVRGLQTKIGKLQQSTSVLDPKQEAVPVSDLDVESKLTAHYRSAWRQQRNVFHPSTRPTCVEELHRQAKQSLRALHRDHHQRQQDSARERRVTICISVAPPMPSYLSPHSLTPQQRGRQLQTFESTRSSSSSTTSSSSTECCHFSPWSRKAAAHADPDDDEVVALGHRPKCPIPNVPTTLDKQTNWSRALPLPTPEEKMKSNSQVVTSCVIPINVTEEASVAASPSAMSAFLRLGFDRDASVRCSLVHSQSVLQRRRKLRRRRTIAGIPRQVQQEDLDSDESPVSRERTVIVHTSPDLALCNEDLSCRLGTKDSGCQTEDSLIAAAGAAAPSRRRIRAQRGPPSLSHSTGNISALPDGADAMFGASAGARLRSRSLPREGGRLADEGRHDDSDEDDEEEELSPYEAEDFLPGPGEMILKEEEEESTDDQAPPDHQLSSLKYGGRPGSPDRGWTERGRSRLPRKADMMGSCEISSSSDTFSSPIHSASTTVVLGGPMDHKEDHQSSSGNWSGSSSTCPSQTSETLAPAASPPLTGSSHGDSELSLNAGAHAGGDDPGGFILDAYQSDRLLPGLRAQRAGSFSSAAMDLLEDAGVSTASEGEWSYPHPEPPGPHDFSPEHSREPEGSLGCPSFTSMATYESFSDKPSSEKDTASHYSIDTEGYYTSMHFDCGLKGSKSFTYNYATAGSDSQSDVSGQGTLGRRCLSLRKPKVKPSPPRRSSSLRQISEAIDSSSSDKSEPKITGGQRPPSSSGERELQLSLAGAPDQGAAMGGEPPNAWGAGGRDEMPPGLFGSGDTHSFKDEGAVQSDYADLWLLNDLKSNSDPYRSLSNSSTATGTTVIECIKSQECLESQTSQSGSRAATPSLPSTGEGDFKLASPDKLAGLASPSSGYSSQSETPTSSFPATFFPGPLSPPGGKRKPKVPERKSSLSSLQLSLSSSKRELELPIIAPTHLDLSALHSVISKPSAHRIPAHIPNESRQKAAAAASGSAKAEGQTRAGKAGSAGMAITPTVLRSVQLKSVGKQGDGGRPAPALAPDAATRPKCPAANAISPATSSKTPEPRKPPAYDVRHSHSQELCESRLSPQEAPVARAWQTEIRFRHDRLAPVSQWSMTAFRAPDQELSQKEEGVTDGTVESEETTGRVSAKAPPSPSGSSSSESELSRPRSSEPSDEDPSPCPANAALLSAQHSLAKRSDEGLDKVPAMSDPPETSQAYPISDVGGTEAECESSGVLTRSASQDSGEDGSTPDAEDYIIKGSTLGDNGSPLTEEQPKAEDDSVFLSPTKTRTTEDLFAMIHRSKRKVLGRKDSGELGARNRSAASPGTGSTPPPGLPATPPSTPLTPTSPATTPTGSHKAPGPIYRSAKKSSTSNEEFKLLLLKKGSRSDSSYRMSATEILKSPVAPKSPGDLLLGDGARLFEEPPFSPAQLLTPPEEAEHLLPGPFPRAGAEGFSSPKALPTSGASRQGRSRIPPPANSSRYGIRSRLYTAPMQAISEGETENSDGSPHDDRSSQGST